MLALVEKQDGEQPKPLSVIRQELTRDWFDFYLAEFGRKCNEPFGRCLGYVKSAFEGVDEESGELWIEYPSREDWRAEIRKFFAKSPNNWYRNEGRCTLYSFTKNYGRFDHHVIAPNPTAIPYDNCQYCGQKVKRTQMTSHYYVCTKNPNLRH